MSLVRKTRAVATKAATAVRAVARGATRAVRRDPVLAVLLALALAVAVLYVVRRRRGREGWEPDGTNAPVDLGEDRIQKFLIRDCANGTSVEQMMAQGKHEWLKKYDRAQLGKVCYEARMARLQAPAKGGGYRAKDDNVSVWMAGRCNAKGRRMCWRNDLRSNYPCMNKNEDKCCGYDGKGCVTVENNAGKEIGWELLKQRRAAAAAAARRPAPAPAPAPTPTPAPAPTPASGGGGGGTPTSFTAILHSEVYGTGADTQVVTTDTRGPTTNDARIGVGSVALSRRSKATLYYCGKDDGPGLVLINPSYNGPVVFDNLKKFSRLGTTNQIGNTVDADEPNWWRKVYKVKVEPYRGTFTVPWAFNTPGEEECPNNVDHP